MATKKQLKSVGKDITVSRAALTPARIFEATAKGVDHGDIDIPEFLKQEGAFTKEAPSGFTPIISFGDDPEKWQPGSWIIAKFIGYREAIGPNKSMMYDFEATPDGKKFGPVSLWGSTIFDNKFRQLGAVPGQWVFMQYLGVVDTSRGMNPAKDYRLATVSDKVVKGMGYSG